MRALTAVSPENLVSKSLALFRAAWVDNLDISNPEIVSDALGDAGPELVAATQDPEIKAKLMATTQDAIDAGAFGAPSFVMNGALYWGNDRLEMVPRYAGSSQK